MMVRARRVRAVVACTRDDECCSPNPKRKDQTHLKGKLANVNKTITQFFAVVKSEHVAEALLADDAHDLDDVEQEQFKELPDMLLKVVAEEVQQPDDDEEEEEVMTSAKLPATPHRIELRDDDVKDEVEPVVTTKQVKADSDLVLPPLKEEEELPKTPVKGKPTQSKVKRRLNNQTATAPPGSKPPATNHKLTEYFPVRRSVRKTKTIVLEEKQRTLEDYLRRGVEDGLRVHQFPDKGRGVVAVRVFARGDFVVEYAGDLIDMQSARDREQRYALDHTAGCYMYYFKHRNTQYCIDATAETGRLGRLVNHSRNGNLVTRIIDLDGKPRLVLVAKDTIQTGEEVSYDYGDRSKESLKHHPWLAY